MMHDFFLFLFGLALLLIGAEGLVRGGATLAKMLGIPSLIIGLTIIGYGTSSPEMAVSAIAAFKGEGALSIGNIIGSNIFNLLVILGILALLKPIKVDSQIINFDLPVMLGATLLLWLIAQLPLLYSWLGIPLIIILIAYTWKLVHIARKDRHEKRPPFHLSIFCFSLAAIVFGLLFLLTGSEFLIEGATNMGRAFGISELVIGLTIVAAGTSIPELATSLVALYRRHTDLAIGNIIGSNIYNVLAILGVSLLASKKGLEMPHEALVFDLPFLLLISFLAYFLLRHRHQITRLTGSIFLVLYVGYIWFLIQSSAL